MASIIKVDTIQTAAGGTPTAADLGLNVTGGVLQVVESSTTSAFTTTSATYADCGLEVSITPTSTSSSLYIYGYMNSIKINGTGQSQCKLFRKIGAGSFTEVEEWQEQMGYNDNTVSSCTPVFKDSPNTTSEVTYKFQFARQGGTATIRLNNAVVNAGSSRSNIVVQEIAG